MKQKQEQIKPRYYTTTPAEVRYHNKLPLGAKILYGEIEILANKKGFCWATNIYFSKLYNVSSRTIQIWIASLIKNKFIEDLGTTKDNFRKLGVKKISPLWGEENFTQSNTSSLSKDKETERLKNLSDFSFKKNPSDLKPRKRKLLGKEVSPAMEIIGHWKSKQGFRKPMLKTINKIKKYLEKDILPKYSVEQIKQSMNNFECETTIKISITDFFILSRYQKAVNKAKLSYFEIFLDTELNKLGKKIQENYNHNFLIDNTINSKKQIQHFNDAAKKLIKFMKGKHLEKAGQEARRIDYIFLLFGAIEDAFGDSFGTGNLCSDYTFNTLMPKYIRQMYGG